MKEKKSINPIKEFFQINHCSAFFHLFITLHYFKITLKLLFYILLI